MLLKWLFGDAFGYAVLPQVASTVTYTAVYLYTAEACSRLMLAASAREKLHAQLAESARQDYWRALSAFLAFELDKAEFDRIALTALGPHVMLHNDLILALLADAQQGEPTELAKASPMDIETHCISQPSPAASLLRGSHSADVAAAGLGQADAANSAHISSCSMPASASAAAPKPQLPKLMLKISGAGGSLAVSTSRPDLIVDRAEEEQVRSTSPASCCHPASYDVPTPLPVQLNALQDRLIEVVKQHGLQVMPFAGICPAAIPLTPCSPLLALASAFTPYLVAHYTRGRGCNQRLLPSCNALCEPSAIGLSSPPCSEGPIVARCPLIQLLPLPRRSAVRSPWMTCTMRSASRLLHHGWPLQVNAPATLLARSASSCHDTHGHLQLPQASQLYRSSLQCTGNGQALLRSACATSLFSLTAISWAACRKETADMRCVGTRTRARRPLVRKHAARVELAVPCAQRHSPLCPGARRTATGTGIVGGAASDTLRAYRPDRV